MRFSLATLLGAVLAVAVFCGLLRYAVTTGHTLIVAEMVAGLVLSQLLAVMWLCLEKVDSLLQRTLMIGFCTVLLADFLGIATLLYLWIEAATDFLF